MNDDHLRIGDEERERAAAELGEHFAHGRLDSAEHAERLDRVWAARTRGELPPLFRDLPGAGFGRGPLVPRAPFGGYQGAFPGTHPAYLGAGRPGQPAWPGRRGPGALRGLPAPFVAVLAVLVALTVVTHLPWVLFGLVVWFFVRARHR